MVESKALVPIQQEQVIFDEGCSYHTNASGKWRKDLPAARKTSDSGG
jgi:hypothetical protein